MAGSYHVHHGALHDLGGQSVAPPGAHALAKARATSAAAFLRLRSWMSASLPQHHNDDIASPLSERAYLAHLLAQLGNDYEVRRQKSQG